MSEKDYIDTVSEANRKLFTTNIPVPKDIDCWYGQATYTKEKKWYRRIYRRLFPIRSYVNWRYEQYYFRVLHHKLILKMDEFIAWGDDMTVNTGKFDNMDPKKIGVGVKGLFE